ncbi:hypothetical protein ABZ826_00045 [Streptomyces sp. NPDC047515]|uniref:hypothetical protein n=1 Tax=Streptomyces sp. NPDC047515 TaxID=3155380 RepID=UPI0033E253AA
MASSQDSQVSSISASGSPTQRMRATFKDVVGDALLAPCEVSMVCSESARDFSMTGTTVSIAAVG